jgi:hypothetical protein
MLACGYAPLSVLDGMETIGSEYRNAWGYTIEKKDD